MYTTSSTDAPQGPYTTPVHFGTLLGDPSGPNSLTLNWNHRQDLSQDWSWTAAGEASWKGTSPGSDWRDVNRVSMQDGVLEVEHPTKDWLGGRLVYRTSVGIGMEWRFRPQWQLDAGITGSWQDSLGRSRAWPGASLNLAWRM